LIWIKPPGGLAEENTAMLPAPPAFLVRLPFALFPERLHAELLARAFNHLMRGQRVGERLRALDSKTVCLHVTDAGCRLRLAIGGDGRLRAAEGLEADVTIRGATEDFLALATRREDPDTLFFHRRLAIEGDTETGLAIKNLLDAFEFDWEAHLEDVFGRTPLAPLVARLAATVTAGPRSRPEHAP
jgi:predicted lipid carrier protein YhbT